MTVSSETSRKTFAGNDVTTSFATSPMVFFDSEDLTVYVVTTATGAAVTLTENSDYTVTGGAGAVGTVATTGLYGAPATGTTLVIVREVAATQESDFMNNDINDADVLETALDKLTMIAAQQGARIDRSLRHADSDVSGASTELPTPRASYFLRWNDAGSAIVNDVLTVSISNVDELPTAWPESVSFQAGAKYTGPLAAADSERPDAFFEVSNSVIGRHALAAYWQADYADEIAHSYHMPLSNDSKTQIAANFVRLVDGDNTWDGAWQSVWGVHNVGGLGADNQTILSYGNNSVWLATGPTSDASWDVLPQDNSVSTGNGTSTNAGLKIVNGLVSGWVGIGAENLTLSSTNYAILIKNDGSVTQLNAVTGGAVSMAINNSVVMSVGSTGVAVIGNHSATGPIGALSSEATPVGGTAGYGILIGNAGVGIFWGSGAPTLGATRGSMYIRTDNGANTSLYVNRDGGTTWAAVTSA